MPQKIPVRHEENHELLGYAVKDTAGWRAQTMFGYDIARVGSQKEAERLLHEQGLSFLTGVWQYLDPDDGKWHPCILKEAYEQRVTVIRTNFMGYQDPDDYKLVTIENPTETELVKN
jgi:hypothetical protein